MGSDLGPRILQRQKTRLFTVARYEGGGTVLIHDWV